MPRMKLPRNSGTKTGRWPMQFLSVFQLDGPNLSFEAINLREIFESMAKISLHALSILKKHMTEFLVSWDKLWKVRHANDQLLRANKFGNLCLSKCQAIKAAPREDGLRQDCVLSPLLFIFT